jgi:hypothetical protein
MQEYRAIIIGPDGHVQYRVELQCRDESKAIELARQFVNGNDVELWQLDRQIEIFRHTTERPLVRQPVIAGSDR